MQKGLPSSRHGILWENAQRNVIFIFSPFIPQPELQFVYLGTMEAG